MNQASTGQFRLLYVCWANQCRSPMAELLFRAGLRGDPRLTNAGWHVSSAGIAARTGAGLHPLAARVLDEWGVEHSDFRSSLLRSELVDSADLILTAERAHRCEVVQLRPDAARRTFTMRQFARLLPAGEQRDKLNAGGPTLVQTALDNRGGNQAGDPTLEDIPDPVGGPLRGFRRTIETIAGTISAFDLAGSIPSAAARPWWRKLR